MQQCNHLLTADANDSLRIFQLTDTPDIPSCHVYMEAPVFTPDSAKIVLHRAAHPHGPEKSNPKHCYLLCDLEDNGKLTPLTGPDEYASTSPAVSPDGKWFYYFIDKTRLGEGRLELRRVRLDGTERESVFVLDDRINGTRFRACNPYPLSTISADGKRIALQVFLGDGYTRSAPFGVLVFDLEKGDCSLPVWGPSFCNMHAQYSRSTDPEHIHDLLLQENHGCITNVEGKMIIREEKSFVDLHVIKDDGSNVRDLVLGGSTREICSGHQAWRGDTEWVISSVISYYGRGLVEDQDFRMIETKPVPHQGHLGATAWWGERNELNGGEEDAHNNHFGLDKSGRYILCDDWDYIKFGKLSDPGMAPMESCLRIADTKMIQGMRSTVDSHPFLSPDGKKGFFNSNNSGQVQAYMIDGLEAYH